MYLDRYREQLVVWVRDGLSDRTIADRVRVSPSTVRYWRERNGVIRPILKPDNDANETGDAPVRDDEVGALAEG